jgi:hypothetical protein
MLDFIWETEIWRGGRNRSRFGGHGSRNSLLDVLDIEHEVWKYTYSSPYFSLIQRPRSAVVVTRSPTAHRKSRLPSTDL